MLGMTMPPYSEGLRVSDVWMIFGGYVAKII
jgi:hypothetical protein